MDQRSTDLWGDTVEPNNMPNIFCVRAVVEPYYIVQWEQRYSIYF